MPRAEARAVMAHLRRLPPRTEWGTETLTCPFGSKRRNGDPLLQRSDARTSVPARNKRCRPDPVEECGWHRPLPASAERRTASAMRSLMRTSPQPACLQHQTFFIVTPL
ncbi:hypothetical protein GCM10009823_30360 [Brevibacterium salitolerans]|uniref:Uncharacterized protein n=1 Tax=Brevibacterium salitolerans TaxID=1403566 RepID=A0ABP5IU03_9MICO